MWQNWVKNCPSPQPPPGSCPNYYRQAGHRKGDCPNLPRQSGHVPQFPLPQESLGLVAKDRCGPETSAPKEIKTTTEQSRMTVQIAGKSVIFNRFGSCLVCTSCFLRRNSSFPDLWWCGLGRALSVSQQATAQASGASQFSSCVKLMDTFLELLLGLHTDHSVTRF